MDFGTMVTEALENRTEKKMDDIVKAIKSLVPSYPVTDKKISTKIMIDKEEVEVMGYMDGWNPRKVIIGEYKTSLYPWSYDKARKHGQMKLYSWIHWKNHKVIPDVELTWMETVKEEGEYFLTGNFLTHKFKYSIKELLEMEVRIRKGYKKIKKVVEKELAL